LPATITELAENTGENVPESIAELARGKNYAPWMEIAQRVRGRFPRCSRLARISGRHGGEDGGSEQVAESIAELADRRNYVTRKEIAQRVRPLVPGRRLHNSHCFLE